MPGSPSECCWAYSRGIATGKGDLQAPFIVGTVGALFGLAGFFAVSATHTASKLDTSITNDPAILGALLGAVFGGIIGAISSLGRLMISIFNPDLLKWEFGTSFGATGGAILDGLFGACLAAAIGAFFSRGKTNMAIQQGTTMVRQIPTEKSVNRSCCPGRSYNQHR